VNEVSEEIGQLQQALRLALEAEDDPQYAPLLEVVREDSVPPGNDYVLRDWSELPPWWLPRLLLEATNKSGLLFGPGDDWDDPVAALRVVLAAVPARKKEA